jgi:hypothetical protein
LQKPPRRSNSGFQWQGPGNPVGNTRDWVWWRWVPELQVEIFTKASGATPERRGKVKRDGGCWSLKGCSPRREKHLTNQSVLHQPERPHATAVQCPESFLHIPQPNAHGSMIPEPRYRRGYFSDAGSPDARWCWHGTAGILSRTTKEWEAKSNTSARIRDRPCHAMPCRAMQLCFFVQRSHTSSSSAFFFLM